MSPATGRCPRSLALLQPHITPRSRDPRAPSPPRAGTSNADTATGRCSRHQSHVQPKRAGKAQRERAETHLKKNKIKKSNKQQQPAFGQESSFLSHALWGLPENTCSYKAQHPPQEGLAPKHVLRKKQGARFNQRAKSHTDSPGTFIRS